MSALSARSLLLAVSVGVAARGARGQRPRVTIGQLDHAVWTVRDGAPSYINALGQTADGVLWIGSNAGLYRFDGVRFEHVDPSGSPRLPRAVNALRGMPDSSLWIGSSVSGVSVLTRGRVLNYRVSDGIPDGRITGITRDSAGDTWVSSVMGLARLHDGHWKRMGAAQQYPASGAGSLFVDRRGALWAPTTIGMYVLPRDGSQFVRQAVSDSSEGGFHTPREAPDGSVWGASSTLGLTRLSDPAGRPMLPRSEVAAIGRGLRSYVDRHGSAWIATFGTGLVRVALPSSVERTPRIERVPLVTGPNANAMLEDPEGNMWLGTGGGVERFRETALTPVVLPTDVQWPALAAASDGAVWLGSYSHRVLSFTNEVHEQAGAPSTATCVYRDLEGGVWFGGARGVWHVAPTSSPLDAHFVPVAPLPRKSAILAMARALDGDLWVGTLAGQTLGAVGDDTSARRRVVFRLHNGEWSPARVPQSLLGQSPFTIVTDSTGRVWIGYTARLVEFVGDSTRVFSDRDGLRVGQMTALLVRGRHLWIGGKTGLAMLEDGRFHMIGAVRPIRDVTGIVETANGDLWVNGTDGVTHIAAAELQRAVHDSAYRMRAELFDEHDGLKGAPVQTVPRPTAIQGTDGRLWFATSSSIAWIDPTNITRNRLPPPVQVRALTAAGKTYDILDRVSLPARTTQLQVAYTALGLVRPDRIRFRYRLTTVDTTWVEAGTRREAFYTNLAPGSYQFRVISANEDGVWNEAGASIDFEIPASFTQTKAFLGLIALLIATFLIGVGWLLALRRQRQVAQTLREQFAGQLAERARVARELHDTLLGDMTGVVLQLSAAARRLDSANQDTGVAELLSSLSTQVRHTLVEARRSVSAIRTTTPDELPPLHQQLENAARRTFEESAITAHVVLEGSPRAVLPTVEAQVVAIASEAMANARQHAECHTVTIGITHTMRDVQVFVRDDGRGFDSSRAAPADHWGVQGMRERAASIGATLSITSAPGAGTEVLIVARRQSRSRA